MRINRAYNRLQTSRPDALATGRQGHSSRARQLLGPASTAEPRFNEPLFNN